MQVQIIKGDLGTVYLGFLLINFAKSILKHTCT